MFLNTSFRYRKNHLYRLRNFSQSQVISQTQMKLVDRLVFHANWSTVVKMGEYAAVRRILGRKTEKLFRLMLVRKPDVMVTAKPREMRMGKGKGAFSYVHLPVRVGMKVFTLTWCHRLPMYLFLAHLRSASKKSGTRLSF